MMWPNDERGGVILFIAILIPVIFGMLVLVVDGGAWLLLSRRVAIGADAAALAAAQSCASEQESEAQEEADEVALGNLDGVAGVSAAPIDAPSCGDGSGTVSVSYSGVQDFYFAPAIGLSSQGTASRSAIAMWAPATSAQPIPIVLSHACQLSCAYWFDPDNDLDEDTFESTFGFARLNTWAANGGSPSSCPNRPPGALTRWIQGPDSVRVPVRVPPPSFVCPVDPDSEADWVPAIQSQLGDSRAFVVGEPALEAGEQFAAVGFSPLTIQSLDQGIGEQAVVCEEIEVEDLVEDDVIDLTLEVLACLLEYGLAGVEIQVAPEGLDYQFNPITNTFRWLDEEIDSITITIGGTQPADGGACGDSVPDEDAWCLVVSNEGSRVGGTEPNSAAPDFGLRAIRLTQDE
jgi:Putative Flp pilus-assembly TadE/G-like